MRDDIDVPVFFQSMAVVAKKLPNLAFEAASDRGVPDFSGGGDSQPGDFAFPGGLNGQEMVHPDFSTDATQFYKFFAF